MLGELSLAGFVLVSLLGGTTGAAPVSLEGGGDYQWLTSDQAPIELIDVRFHEPTILRPEKLSDEYRFRLSFEFPYFDRFYDELLVSRDGWLDPRAAGEGNARRGASPGAPPAEPLIEVYSAPLFHTPDSRIVLEDFGSFAVVRWVHFFHPSIALPVTFEAHLHEDGRIVYQYLFAGGASPGPTNAPLTIGLRDPAGRRDLLLASHGELLLDKFTPETGLVVVLAPPFFAGACGEAENWCVQIDDPTNPTNQDPFLGVCSDNAGVRQYTDCSTRVTDIWRFNENQYCRGCEYTFYILVDCGVDMHIPFWDVEASRVKITDVFTGTVMALEAQNECARTPFSYCDGCSSTVCSRWMNTSYITPAPDAGGSPPGSCNRVHVCNLWGGPVYEDLRERPCVPFFQSGPVIEWGDPSPPYCEPTPMDCDPSTGLAYGTGANPAFEEQDTEIILRGSPGLCGIFRIEIDSGGYEWDLFANCDGTNTPQYRIFQNCGDALDEFDPRPELIIREFRAVGVCPDVELEVEIANVGCVETVTSPVRITFDNGDPDVTADLGIIGPNTVVRRVFSISPTSRMIGRVEVDPPEDPSDPDDHGTVEECSESETATRCSTLEGFETAEADLCACSNNIIADVGGERFYSCMRNPVAISGADSTVEPCSGGTAEYRILHRSGAVFYDWQASPDFQINPASCPSLALYTMEVRCSSEQLDECVDAVDFEIECTLESVPMSITPDGVEICEGSSVLLDAGSAFHDVRWSTFPPWQDGDGAVGNPLRVTPTQTTTYYATGADYRNCEASDSTTITVVSAPPVDPVGTDMRAGKEGSNIRFTWTDLLQQTGDYELILYAGYDDPTPAVMETAATVIDSVPPGTEEALHLGGVASPSRLIYYKVRATRLCLGLPGGPGPTCNYSCAEAAHCYATCP